MARQVRLDDDVVAVLTGAGYRPLSLSAAANGALREALGLAGAATAPSPAGERPESAQVAHRAPAAAGSGERPAEPPASTRASAHGPRSMGGRCRHPITRRIGERCAACGDVVP